MYRTMSESKALGEVSATVRNMIMELPRPSMMSKEEEGYLKQTVEGTLAVLESRGTIRRGFEFQLNFTHMGVDFTHPDDRT